LPDESVAHRNRLDFEMAATKQRRYPNKFPRRQFLSSEITAVGRVEFVVEGKIGRSNLHVHEIVHRHVRFYEGVLHMIQKQSCKASLTRCIKLFGHSWVSKKSKTTEHTRYLEPRCG